MKDLLKGKATNPHLSVSAFFARSLQGLIHHYLSQYKHFRNGNEHKSELNIFRFCCHKLSVQILLFFPQLQSFAQRYWHFWEAAQDSFLKTAILFHRWLTTFHKAKSGKIYFTLQYLMVLLSFRISTKACFLSWNLHSSNLKIHIFTHHLF